MIIRYPCFHMGPIELQGARLTSQLTDYLYWGVIGSGLVNLTQRRFQAQCQRKRVATLIIAGAFMAAFAGAIAVVQLGGRDWMTAVLLAVIVVAMVVYREYAFPFRFTNPRTGRLVTIQQFLYDDAHGAGDEAAPEDAPPTQGPPADDDEER